MSPEFLTKWEHILQDVEKQQIPIQFIKKLVIRLTGKKQQTINIAKLLKQGLATEQVEDVLNRKMEELDESITSIDFILNVESIAETVQPETDRLLNRL